MKNKFVFILGREQEIALAELKSVWARFGFVADIYKISGNLVFANIDNFSKDDALGLATVLGGTIKIFQILIPTSYEYPVIGLLKQLILDEKKDAEHKVNFGISDYSKRYSLKQINEFGIKVKTYLKKDLKLRFVALREGTELTSIVSLKDKLALTGIEFGLFTEGIGILIGLNNPEDWSIRDYEKPAFDKFSGMVPPKLAREMVNLALGQMVGSWESVVGSSNEKNLVVDPFCGSGNILLEAMLLNCDVIGSDISEKAVSDTKMNLLWAKEQYPVLHDIKAEVSKADATVCNFTELITEHKPLAVVTEPYLGEPKKFKPTLNAAKGEYLKIKELYFDFLKNIAPMLNSSDIQLNSVVCLVFPLVETLDKGQYSLFKESVDEIRKLGYTQIRNSFIYGRDYQVVKREIVLLRAI